MQINTNWEIQYVFVHCVLLFKLSGDSGVYGALGYVVQFYPHLLSSYTFSHWKLTAFSQTLLGRGLDLWVVWVREIGKNKSADGRQCERTGGAPRLNSWQRHCRAKRLGGLQRNLCTTFNTKKCESIQLLITRESAWCIILVVSVCLSVCISVRW